MVPHNRLTFDKKEENAIRKIVRSGYWASGNEVKKLEKEIAKIAYRKYVVGVSSGLSALRLALLALGVSKNDEVIIPAYACVAIPNAVLSCGAVPVLSDINIVNWNIDANQIPLLRSSKTKAIIAVNTFGSSANFKELNDNEIPVIEDCAHALGEDSKGYIFGKQSIISISSFYATKLIGGGEGGAVMTDKKNIANFIIDYKDYTDKASSGLRLNDKMSNIDASISLCQAKRLNSMIKSRKEIAKYYNEEFLILKEQFPEFVIPVFENRIWYRYIVYCKQKSSHAFINEIRINGVKACRPVENWIENDRIVKYPKARFAYNHLVSLPIYPTLTKKEREVVVQAVRKSLKKLSK
jgi:perosamine synthetase